jgi:thiol-disulfide isomerase/thioredoxin
MSSSLFRNLLILVALLAAGYFWYSSRQPRYITGEAAADFEVTLLDGRTARLSDLRGRHVLLQFWGSWCGPCRAENRHLVKLYQKYHDRGFDIFSVGLESNERAWKLAIQQDSLLWPYHSVETTQFDGPVAKLYNIHSIPSTFLINAEGVIIGVDLLPSQMDKLLAQRLP